jgi:hypothetical protein
VAESHAFGIQEKIASLRTQTGFIAERAPAAARRRWLQNCRRGELLKFTPRHCDGKEKRWWRFAAAEESAGTSRFLFSSEAEML